MRDGKRTLFAELRRQQIMELLQAEGTVTVEDMCKKFGVSSATVRTDLTWLENMGQLKRTHGGAISASNGAAGFELTSLQKENQHVTEKEAIARIALQMIKPGDFIALDTGTTTLELARLLQDFSNITVVTYDIKIAEALEKNEGCNLLLLGGFIRHHFHCVTGKVALSMLDKLHLDKAFIGTNGVSLERGLSTPSMPVAEIKRKFCDIASEKIVLTDSSKIGREAFISFAGLEDIDVIITDSGVENEFLDKASQMDTKIMIAGVENSPAEKTQNVPAS